MKLKKLLTMGLTGAFALGMVYGVGAEEKELVGFSTIDLGSAFFSELDEGVHELLEAEGYEVKTVSCERNAATQITDIENLISMGCDTIFYIAMDPAALVDVCIKGREAGVKMYSVAFQMPDAEAYDALITADARQQGIDAAQYMADWVEATFPDAEDDSVEIAMVGLTGTPEAVERTEGLQSLEELSSKVKLVEMYDLVGVTDPIVKSQGYAEMAMSSYPNLKGFLSYGADSSLGLNEAYMRDANLNKDEFAIVGVDVNQVICDEIKASAENDSLIRGHVSAGDNLAQDILNCLTGASLENMGDDKKIMAQCSLVTVENVDAYVEEYLK